VRLAWFLLFALLGCDSPEPPIQEDLDVVLATPKPACQEQQFERTTFTVCPFDAAKDRLELIDGRDLRSFANLEASLGPRTAELRFAMNAGMYDEEGAPIGLFVADGKEIKPINRRGGSGNFHLMPNGVFAIAQDGKLSVTPAKDFKLRSPRWATQSGPMLLIEGKLHPKFDKDGESQLIRNGVGVKDANTAFFVISEDPVSFGRFARFFRDALGAGNALYLDGSVSSLWDPGGGRQDAYSQLGPMVAIFRNAPSSER
jgi:prepilin-type processing-associated H-X9-DG protein